MIAAEPKASQKVATVLRHDHVFFHVGGHPHSGEVLSTGRDGITVGCNGKHPKDARCDGKRHRVMWNEMLGYKKRSAPAMRVVDRGEDGAILEDTKGRRVYAHGWEEPTAKDPGENNTPVPMTARPRIADEEEMHKASPTVILFGGDAEVFAKAIKNAPGLALRDVTDKKGRQTKRWTKVAPDQPRGPHNVKHGDHVKFKMGTFAGKGRVHAAGKDGATVHDGDGREHTPRWHEVTHHAEAGEDNGGKKPPEKPAAVAAGDKDGGGEKTAVEAAAALFPADAQDHLPEKATQPTNDKDELFKLSGPALAHFRSWLDEGNGICDKLGYQTMTKGPDDLTPEEWSKPGGMLFIAKLKGEKRSVEKVETDYKGDWSKLCDVVRGTIAVDKVEDLKAVVDRLKTSGLKLARKAKNRFVEPTKVGYRDVLLNIEFPNGTLGELQLNVKPMLMAKNEGHDHYETERSLIAKHTPKGAEEHTPLSTWPEEDQRAYNDALAEQKRIYGGAWKEVTAGGADEEPGGDNQMRKAAARDRIVLFSKGGLGMAGEFEYFEHEGAFFRRPKNLGTMSVTHVRAGNKWEPYKGDRLAPAHFGSEVTEEAAMAGMGEEKATAE
jgi:hypothetical protein